MHDRNVHPMKDQIYDRLQQKQTLNKQYYDQHAKDLSPLTEGQQVTVQDHVTGKWSPATIHSIMTLQLFLQVPKVLNHRTT